MLYTTSWAKNISKALWGHILCVNYDIRVCNMNTKHNSSDWSSIIKIQGVGYQLKDNW